MMNREALVDLERGCGHHGLRVAIECEQPAGRPELRQDRAAVPATTKGAVDVAACRLEREPLQHFREQDRLMFDTDGRLRDHYSDRESMPAGRPPVPTSVKAASCWSQAGGFHNLKCVP